MPSVIVRRNSVYRQAFAGPFGVSGTLSNIGSPNAPVRRRVRLHEQSTGQLVRETWSAAADGVYAFTGLAAGTYFAVAFDHTGQYGGVIETDVVLPTLGA